MSLVEVENLSVTFGPGRRRAVVRGVSLSVAPGECVALVGESGSGKSVTARSLIGLAGGNATVTADRLVVAGRDATVFGPNDWRAVRGRQVGLVLQDALVSLDPLRRVGSEIAEAVRLHGDHPDIAERVVELLTDVGVPEPEARRSQYPHQLSGGLRQRALIASALAGDPRLLIADEPTTALDVVVQAQILRLLARIVAAGRGLLLISHDLAVVAELADRVLVLRDGEVVESGPTRQVIDEPAHPYTRQLIDAVPRATGRDARPGDAVVLRAESVTKTYQTGHRRALDDVSFVLHAGESLGVVGESGSGKSTLARVVMGLLSPDSGQVLLDEQDWSTVPERSRRRRRNRIQLVQQDAYAAFDPRFTVARIVGEALPALGRRKRRQRVVELLRQVELGPEYLTRRPHQLSGGQRQRVAIARALAPEPKVLVCDEPVSALDVSVQARVLDLLDTLRRGTGVALVFITHDLAVVRLVADQVMIMKDGRVVERGPTGAVFGDPCHEYTRTLVASIPSLADARQVAGRSSTIHEV
ncbi:MAG: ABC transporter ATP-binding protein [Kibdelosporangium sp.]